jgi:hypothetical protein
MANYYLGFNCGSLVDTVEEHILVGLDGGDDQWEKEEWGFCTPTNFENRHNDLLYAGKDGRELDKFLNENISDERPRDGEIMIESKHPNFDKIIELVLNNIPECLDEKKKFISIDEWKIKIKLTSKFIVTICECESGC